MSADDSAPQRRLAVGVSILVRKGEQSLWENGIFQNCLFLVQLLLRSPRVGKVFLVSGGGDGGPADATFLADAPVPIIDMAEAAQTLDVMVEMSAQLGREWVEAFRGRGGKIASMRVGNDYVIDIERMVFDKPHGLVITGAPYHAVWTLPQYEATCVPYFASAMRAPVRRVPHLWSPALLERGLARERQNRPALPFGYRPGRRRWRVGMFEPNVCSVKASHLPMLVAESAHRADARLLEHVYCYNTWHMKDHPLFNGFANSLDIVRHGIASFEGRFAIYLVLGPYIDAVISHHWENGQNYVYYEALYGNYPLVHNSHLLGDCGYRYDGFDCEEGGQTLQLAFARHDQGLDGYRANARQLFTRLDPESDANVRAYTEAIEDLYRL